MCRTSIYEARNNFSSLIKKVEEGEIVELTRYDKPVAVIVSYSIYEKENQKNDKFFDDLMTLRAKFSDVLTDEGIPCDFEKEYSRDTSYLWEE